MAVSTIQVTPQALKKKKSEMEDLISQLKSQVKDMDATEKSLLGMWEGDAAKAFDATYDKNSQLIDNLISLIKKYIELITQMLLRYEMAERANIQTAKKRG